MATSPEPRTFEDSGHPMLGVKSQPARIADLLQLWLDKDTGAFSSSVKQILGRASAIREPRHDGLRIVGVSAFHEALIEYSQRWRSSNTETSLKNTLLDFLLHESGEPYRKDSGSAQSKGPHQSAPSSNADIDIDVDAVIQRSIASPWLTGVLTEASRIAYTLAGEPANTGVNEVVAASLATAPFQRALFTPGAADGSGQQALSRLRRECKDTLSRTNDPHARDWIDVLDGIKGISPPGPVAESERRYIADRPLDSLDEDVLGTSDDARALAEVICLRKPGPPLAVGLFGDWGSGKSTFMNMLEAAIEEICEQVTEKASRPASDSDTPGALEPFIRKAVHIRFNAWTYNDANLWASLATEFFQQLRSGGFRRRGQADYARLLDSVARRVTESEGLAAEKGQEAVSERAKVRKLAADIRSVEQSREQLTNNMLAEAGTELVRSALSDGGGAVQAALKALGHSTPSRQDAAAIAAFREGLSRDIIDLAKAPGQVSALLRIGKIVLERAPSGFLGWLFWLSVLATLLLAVVTIAGDAIGLLAPLASGVAALGSLWRIAQPILGKLEKHIREMERESQAIDRTLAEKRNLVVDHELKAASAESEYAAAEAEAARFRGGRPEQVLEFFLGESKEVLALQAELGTVSRVRRAFEALDAIMSAKQAVLKRENGEPLTAEEERLVGELAAEKKLAKGEPKSAAAPTPELPDFERIVIYIDDLDRCRAEQVVKVLEAVHLLLAFPLFVVVVGVDPRWLVNSLRHFYRTELGPHREDEDVADDLGAVPKEYLEKIFQIPVNLRALSQGKGGSFEFLIDSIIGPREEVVPAAAIEAAPASVAKDGKRFDIQAVALELAPESETIEEKTQRIAMLQAEIDAMVMVGPLAGASPRAVKRLVNVYRFVRGFHRGDDLSEFLHGPGRRRGRRNPRYLGVLFWLALDSGMPADQIQRLRTAVALMNERACKVIDIAITASAPSEERPTRIPEPAWRKLEEFWGHVPPSSRQDYVRVLTELGQMLPGPSGFKVIKETINETTRFSFASLHSETDV